MINVTLSSEKPPMPSNSDYAIYIDFKKSSSSPQRVFKTADALITALEKLDKTLCETIDSHIKPILALEEIEAGSIKIWLTTILESIDDQALKDVDWKKQVGKYLVKAKYAVLEWVNKPDSEKTKIIELSQEITRIAQETNVKFLPDYKSPPAIELVQRIKEISLSKEHLSEGDKLNYIEKDRTIKFDLTSTWSDDKLSDLLTKEIVSYPEAPMILAVKKPDYLGSSKWELRHGKKSILAKITHSEWLTKFQNREVDVRPGDALRCIVTQEFHYGFDNELITENYTIVKVVEVLENQYKQTDLFKDDKN